MNRIGVLTVTDNRHPAEFPVMRPRQEGLRYAVPAVMSPLPANPVPGMAYVPFQTDTHTYDYSKGFAAGTIFPCLDKPFSGGKCK